MADLMNPGGGLTKSKLFLANANPSDVSQGKGFYSNGNKELQTGTLVERGASQNAGGIGSGGSGSSAYIALNRIPEGIYRSSGEDWAPEIRVNKAELSLYILNSLLGTFYISTTPNDEIWYGGRGARRSSSAKAVWFAHFTSSGHIGWTCASFSSSGANLSSITSYGDSAKKSASGSLGHTVYYSYMTNRIKERDSMRVKINGTTKYIRLTNSSVMITDSDTLSSEIINMLEQLLV